MTAGYGFTSTVTAQPGKGDDLVALLRTALDPGNPGSSEYCLLFLISQSAANPDVVFVAEGWTSEADHHRIFATPAAQAIVAATQQLAADATPYTDFVPRAAKSTL
ncbi:antibiotic biosynthesis monooxygenase [Kribbella sandramycini]|uniref:Antibiotic biosynthesis monooxygenase n=1 Tax=Kribbella sandramycini TaxID=60450 RepID=A0A7Y4P0N1_9ACTN|nr:antibiotic biosynthesis monooxygenase [Kribbella sandramycini]MBB6571258.1 quinol monooxygenase YgiN [Kribbella sandramycini]NOL43337.1 antibiotic biosynthesis monooxygenase [Kribbella sandramycini]